MKALKIVLITIMLPLCSYAWNNTGHSMGGAIAYYFLKEHNPATLEKVVEALKKHPWYTLHGATGWADKLAGLNGEQKKVMLFMLASTFPDDARSTPYNHPNWHYINYAFVPAGQKVMPKQPKKPNAQVQLDSLLSTLPAAGEGIKKAIGLCWLFHLVEDVHQPLHCVSLFTSGLREGDKGGNDTYIRFNTGKAVKLHAYWDRLIKGSVTKVPAKAQALLHNPAYKKLPELTTGLRPADWIYKESYAIAKTDVYLDGAIRGTKNAPAKVSSTYAVNSAGIAEKRIVLAGIRLALQLETLFP